MCSSGVVLQSKRVLLFFFGFLFGREINRRKANICGGDDATLNSPLEIDYTARPARARAVVFGNLRRKI